MIKKLTKILKKICIAFFMIYGLNLLLATVNIYVPINVITIIVVSLLGAPGLLGLVITYLLI